jgi:hypothetical protein
LVCPMAAEPPSVLAGLLVHREYGEPVHPRVAYAEKAAASAKRNADIRRWVQRVPDRPKSLRRVALALGGLADSNGWVREQSILRIGERAEVSRRTAARCLALFEAQGFISVERYAMPKYAAIMQAQGIDVKPKDKIHSERHGYVLRAANAYHCNGLVKSRE